MPSFAVEPSYLVIHITGMEREIINRSEGKALGLTRYFTGKPCCRGHIAERNVSNGNCYECKRAYSRAYDDANRDKIIAYCRARYAANKDKWVAYAAARREKIAAARREKAERAQERAPV